MEAAWIEEREALQEQHQLRVDEVNVRASKAQCSVVLLEAQIEELQVQHEEEVADAREEAAAALQEVCNLLASLDRANAEATRWKHAAQRQERARLEHRERARAHGGKTGG